MALGKRQQEQQEMWVATKRVAQVARAPVYKRLNQLLAAGGVRPLGRTTLRTVLPRPHRPSRYSAGVYFRMISSATSRGSASQRGIAWRCSDSRSLAEFLACRPRKKRLTILA